jgi:hydroxymethylpyrimidine pyrophosphatase-like HAD family hydrolase
LKRSPIYYRCLLISPSDVKSERIALLEQAQKWNALIGQALEVRVELVLWETHTVPDSGAKAQASINKQIVDECDFGIAVFWARLGTATDSERSGSVEEIKRLCDRGQPVLVYFSTAPVPQEALNDSQYTQLQTFKQEQRESAFPGSYKDLDDLREQFMLHLTSTVAKLLEKERTKLSEKHVEPRALTPPLADSSKVEFDLVSQRAKTLIFDIDGTVLFEHQSFQEGAGREWLRILRRLAQNGFQFVFISGNDREKQYPRVLQPMIDSGLGDSVFCFFTDGGSRAFKYSPDSADFIDVDEYSRTSIIKEEDKLRVVHEFEAAVGKFLKEHESLRKPHVLHYDRTLRNLDVIIRPIRPSAYREPKPRPLIDKFYEDLDKCFHAPPKMTTHFEILTKVSYAVIIRAHGESPTVDNDVTNLIDRIHHKLLTKEEYKDIAQPEADVRGGNVTCQIALKPFNDDELRQEFRDIMEPRLNSNCDTKFGVFVAGRTTIDVQRDGVDKSKAIKFMIEKMGLRPSEAIYFGDEFVSYGNDLAVAKMQTAERPGLIVHVGNIKRTPEDVKKDLKERLICDGNGPEGTMNHLKMLAFQTSRKS